MGLGWDGLGCAVGCGWDVGCVEQGRAAWVIRVG